MLNPEKYVCKNRQFSHRKKKLLKWSPELGKYVDLSIQPKINKERAKRKKNGDVKYRRYKLGN